MSRLRSELPLKSSKITDKIHKKFSNYPSLKEPPNNGNSPRKPSSHLKIINFERAIQSERAYTIKWQRKYGELCSFAWRLRDDALSQTLTTWTRTRICMLWQKGFNPSKNFFSRKRFNKHFNFLSFHLRFPSINHFLSFFHIFSLFQSPLFQVLKISNAYFQYSNLET